MPDPTPTPTPVPTPTPTPEPATQGRARSGVNKAHLDELQKAGEIVNAALKADYAKLLAKRDIKAEDVTALQNDVKAARGLAGSAVQKTSAKEGVSGTEADLKDALVALLQDVQKAAKQKATKTGDNTLLKKYAGGDKFYRSRTILEQTAANFLATAAADKLPGIDQAALDAIQQALAAYQQVQTDQTGAQSSATTERKSLDAAVEAIVRRRREIQIAADALWPASNAANAGIRAEFKIPPDKMLK